MGDHVSQRVVVVDCLAVARPGPGIPWLQTRPRCAHCGVVSLVCSGVGAGLMGLTLSLSLYVSTRLSTLGRGGRVKRSLITRSVAPARASQKQRLLPGVMPVPPPAEGIQNSAVPPATGLHRASSHPFPPRMLFDPLPSPSLSHRLHASKSLRRTPFR
ncbi:hypothetical protein F5888DRAFT_411045 [Russula emetica]|nr:hypothetical protein F5888DRAFT_411045 [Russula emetica]